ncbi:dihydroxyacetone kinase subunit DhaK [bacterium]|nr:MAG: dihydroxyacetone kinase subunit DhaK [bacterium]
MQKILNRPDDFVDEMVEGLTLAHHDQLRALPADRRVIVRVAAPAAGKVAIVTGGGSGHLPVFVGYVGEGLADGCAVGNVFSSPSSSAMLNLIRAVDGGAGVLQLYGNYAGDGMNFDMAAEDAEADGIKVRVVRVADDVASAPRSAWRERRGVAGLFFAYKIAGARAAEGASLDEVVATAHHAVERISSMGVALSPCTVPAAGRPTFSLPEGTMEIGMGIHGEPGVRRGPLESADRIARELVDAVAADQELVPGTGVALLVNGLGATPREELYILYRAVHRLLAEREVSVDRAYVGEYATALEMAGASVSVLKLDADLTRLLDAPARSPFFIQP